MNGNASSPVRLLCWEGYDAPAITSGFAAAYGRTLEAECLLSDAAAADALMSGVSPDYDLININNAYLRDCLDPAGLVQALDPSLDQHYRADIHPVYERFLPWSYRNSGELIGIGQRFGPFNLVINNQVISRSCAEDEGFGLADNPDFRHRYGILDYPDFNLFHICIGADINPFETLSEAQIETFQQTARRWLENARLLDSDHHRLNRALLSGEIDFYISGGIYTVSPARLDGCKHLLAVTPARGPIQGRGGIAFTEVTAMLAVGQADAARFLDYMLDAETAMAIAFVDGTCNPVAQMGNPRVFNAFSQSQLEAIQWDDLASQLEHCADYQIPPDRQRLLPLLEQLKHRYRPDFGG